MRKGICNAVSFLDFANGIYFRPFDPRPRRLLTRQHVIAALLGAVPGFSLGGIFIIVCGWYQAVSYSRFS
jgi:hypothetical protein